MILKSILRIGMMELALQSFFENIYLTFCSNGLPYPMQPIKGQHFSKISKGIGHCHHLDCTITEVYKSSNNRLTLIEFTYNALDFYGTIEETPDSHASAILEGSQLFV